jgi:hypothetical protein
MCAFGQGGESRNEGVDFDCTAIHELNAFIVFTSRSARTLET